MVNKVRRNSVVEMLAKVPVNRGSLLKGIEDLLKTIELSESAVMIPTLLRDKCNFDAWELLLVAKILRASILGHTDLVDYYMSTQLNCNSSNSAASCSTAASNSSSTSASTATSWSGLGSSNPPAETLGSVASNGPLSPSLLRLNSSGGLLSDSFIDSIVAGAMMSPTTVATPTPPQTTGATSPPPIRDCKVSLGSKQVSPSANCTIQPSDAPSISDSDYGTLTAPSRSTGSEVYETDMTLSSASSSFCVSSGSAGSTESSASSNGTGSYSKNRATGASSQLDAVQSGTQRPNCLVPSLIPMTSASKQNPLRPLEGSSPNLNRLERALSVSTSSTSSQSPAVHRRGPQTPSALQATSSSAGSDELKNSRSAGCLFRLNSSSGASSPRTQHAHTPTGGNERSAEEAASAASSTVAALNADPSTPVKLLLQIEQLKSSLGHVTSLLESIVELYKTSIDNIA